jgi:hypothetical protein
VLGAELALHRSAETKMGNGELPSRSRTLFSVRSADAQRRCLYLTDGGLISVRRRRGSAHHAQSGPGNVTVGMAVLRDGNAKARAKPIVGGSATRPQRNPWPSRSFMREAVASLKSEASQPQP